MEAVLADFQNLSHREHFFLDGIQIGENLSLFLFQGVILEQMISIPLFQGSGLGTEI